MRRQLAGFLAIGILLGALGRPAFAEEKEAEKPIEPAAVNLGRPVDFERDIAPILDANCVACHNFAITESKLSLESLDDLRKGGKRGPAVVPKEPEKSLLYQVAARGKQPAMPPLPNEMAAEALTPEELGLLRQWILEGAAGGSGRSHNAIQWQPIPSGLNAIYSVALSPWARFVAAGRANQIVIYDLATGTETDRLVDPNLLGLQHGDKPMYGDGAAHRDFVHSLAFSPDGNLLASGGYRVVKLWQRPDNVQTAKVATSGEVTAVALSADGRWAAIGSVDHAIKLHDLSGETPERTLSGHAGPVSAVQFSPDGAKLVSGSQDKTIRVWNVADGAAVRSLETPAPVNGIALNKDGTQIVSGHADHIIRLWAAEQGGEAAQAIREFKGHSQPVTSVALLRPEGNQFVSGGQDGTVRIWDLNNGTQVREMSHGGPVTAVAVRHDGQVVASAGANNVTKLWQANNGQQKAEMKGGLAAQREVVRVTEAVEVAKQLVGVANNGVAAADKNLKDREAGLKSAKEAKEKADQGLAEPEKTAKEATEKLEAAKKELAGKPDDEALKKKAQDAEKELAQANEALQKAKEAQASAERDVERSEKAIETAKADLEQANAEKTAAEERHKQVEAQLAEARTVYQATEVPFRAVAFAPDSPLLVTGGDAGVVQVWNGETGTALESFTGHQAAVTALAFGPDGRVLSGSADKTAMVWDADPEWKLVGQLGPNADDPLDLSASPFVDRVLALDFSPDGKLLATGGGEPSRSGELMIWDVERREIVQDIEDAHSDTVLGLEFSRDGRYLLSGAADKFAKIFEVAGGRHVRSFEGHTHHVLDVSWKADGRTIVTAGADNAIKVWTVETGEQQRTIGTSSRQVTSIGFLGTGETIVSGGGDKTVRFHKATDGQNFRNFGGTSDYVYSVAAARDESLVVAGGEDGVLRVWDGKNGQLIKSFEPPKPPAPNQQASAAGKQH